MRAWVYGAGFQLLFDVVAEDGLVFPDDLESLAADELVEALAGLPRPAAVAAMARRR